MLNHGTMSEAQKNEVTIDDFTPDVMQKFLDFVIGKDIKLNNAKETSDMLMAAHKYNVSALVRFCKQKESKTKHSEST
jgi:hypothetical protein